MCETNGSQVGSFFLEETMETRQDMIDTIEGAVGLWGEVPWDKFPTDQLKLLYFYVKTQEYHRVCRMEFS